MILRPEVAVKLHTALRHVNLSLGGLLNEALRRMPVDENGAPAWAGEFERPDDQLSYEEAPKVA